MPRVPRYDERQVAPAPTQIPRLQPAATEETFGGGAALKTTLTAAGAVNETLQKVIIEQKRQASEAQSIEADLEYGKLSNSLQIELSKMKGKDAFGSQNVLDDTWRKKIEEIDKNLIKTDEARFLARKKAQARYLSISEWNQVRMERERQIFETETTDAYIANEETSAALNFNNPREVTASRIRQQQAFLRYADMFGLGDEQIEEGISKMNSSTTSAVIDAFIGAGDAEGAEKFYNENKETLRGGDLKRITPEYIEAQKAAVEKEKMEMEKARMDANEYPVMLRFFNREINLSEAQRLFENKTIDKAMYSWLQDKITNRNYLRLQRLQFGDPKIVNQRFTDPSVFNEIRELQDSQADRGEIKTLIKEKADGLSLEDAKYLTGITERMPKTPFEEAKDAAVKSIRSFAGRYLKTPFFYPSALSEKVKNEETERLVYDFHKRIDKEKPTPEKVMEIAEQTLKSYVSKRFPDIAKMDDLPDFVMDSKRKVNRFFDPGRKSSLKADYTVTRKEGGGFTVTPRKKEE